jgi:HD-GYP domain-containing protein (c-di-GMP phosphodiesterase class II)
MSDTGQTDAYSTLLGTLEALASRSDLELWPTLLESAVAVVPGAEAGSILLRQGNSDDFKFVAQIGFSDALFELATPESALKLWYGDDAGWYMGEPRISSGRQLGHTLETDPGIGEFGEKVSLVTAGRMHEIQDNLALPILVAGRVVAELNLDHFSSPKAFDQVSVSIARQYSLQVTALLSAREGRAELEARSREFEALERIINALQGVNTSLELAVRVSAETSRLLESPHLELMRVTADRSALESVHSCGIFESEQSILLPLGRGLSWAAISERQIIFSQNALDDPRVELDGLAEAQPPHAQLTVPMFDSRQRPLGVMLIARESPASFTELDQRLVRVIANATANTFERVLNTEQLALQNRESDTLLALARLLEGNNERALEQALEQVRVLGAADVSLLASVKNGLLEVQAMAGQVGSAALELLRKPAVLSHLLGDAVADVRITLSGPVEVPDTAQTQHFMPLAQAGLRSALLVTSLGEEGEIFVLGLFRGRASTWTASETRMVQGSVGMIGALQGRVDRLQNLEIAYEHSLRALGVALEARDQETAGHTDRVVGMALELGKELELSGLELRDLRWGAFLHDIGKLSVPDAILLKPGKLTPDEWDLMRSHSMAGFELTLNLPFLPDGARAVVRHHHERIDGKGYPDGLKGEQIPFAARIFAVCDVFDALMSDRPYKSAMTFEQTMHEIALSVNRGHLEPRIVEALERMLAKGWFPEIHQGTAVPNVMRVG